MADGTSVMSSDLTRYHEDVDDNAFTNMMARWNIARGLEAIETLRAAGPSELRHCARNSPLVRMSSPTGAMRRKALSPGSMRQPEFMSSSTDTTNSSRSIYRSMPIAKCRSTW